MHKNNYFKLTIFFIFWLSIPSFAQKDSLTLLYENAPTDSSKYEVLIELCHYYVENRITSPDAKAYYDLFLEEAEIRNDHLNVSDAHQCSAQYYYDIRAYEKAIPHAQKALEIAENVGHFEIAGYALHRLYLNYLEQKKYKESISAILQAQQYAIKCKNCYTNTLMNLIDGSLGGQYYLLKDYEAAIVYNKRVLEYNDKKKRIPNTLAASVNIAALFLQLSKPDSAQFYLNKRIGGHSTKTFSFTKGFAYNTQSVIDYQQGNYDSSILNAQKAIDIGSPSDEVEGLINLAEAYAKKNDKKSAHIHLKKAHILTKNKVSSFPLDIQKKLYASFISLYKETDKEKALDYAIKLNALEDSIRQDQHSLQVANLSIKNEVQLKELKNVQLQKEQVLKTKAIRNLQFGLMGLGVLTSLILFGFWQIKQKNQAIQFKNGQLEKLNYTISHDGLVYISSILSYINFSFSTNKVEQPNPLTSQLHNIHRTATQLKKMMRNIILSFKLDNNQGISVNQVALDDIVQEVLANLSLIIEATNATVQVAPLPVVQANREMMIQLFQNLISNALKYKKEDVPPVIKISHQSKGTNFQFIVVDNGIGISEKNIKSIFSPFSQVAKEGVQGFGLGLSICQQIVERHSGEICVKSAINKGSRFCFTLPKILNLD